MAKKHMKKCSPSLAIKEMHIKITLRFHLTPVRIATIKNNHHKQMLVKIWEKRNLRTLLVRMEDSTNNLEKNVEAS
jgi:hypothetical protein